MFKNEPSNRGFVNSKINKTTGQPELFKKPYIEIVPKN